MIQRVEIEQLSADLSTALLDLHEYKIIYTQDQDRIALLNETAPFFFVKLHEYYWNRFVMAISRFTDPARQNNFENLSIRSLQECAEDFSDAKQELEGNISAILELANTIRNYRDKFISHRDKESRNLLPEDMQVIHIENVETIFSLIDNCLNLFYHHFDNTHVDHDPVLVLGGAQILMHYLSEGKKGEVI